MKRRRRGAFTSSPVLIGALTTLVVIVAVVLAYGANTGLPFVPSYTLHVQASNASELQKGDDIDEGGALVGIVSSVTASRTHAGRPVALLNLKLYKNIEPLPTDTSFTVRLKGAIGLKYLSVNRGHASTGFKNNATVPLGHAGSSVDFDQVLDMFGPKTRTGVRKSTIGLGQALAGRGYGLNQAIGAFGPLLADLQPVAANLASSKTDLAGFFEGLNRFTGALGPVASTQAQLFSNLDTTFTALARVSPALRATIAATPPALNATINDSPTIRPFLTDFASLLHQLKPGFATLDTSAPILASTFATGRRTLPGTVAIDNQLVKLSQRLQSYSGSSTVQAGLQRLTKTAGDLRQPLRFLAPVQSGCNYVTLFLRNVSSLLSEHVSQGGFLRFVQIAITDLPGRESEPSHTLYTGKKDQSSGPVHADPYPNTDSPGEVQECSAGHESFVNGKAVVGNPPGNVGDTTEATQGQFSTTTSTTSTTSSSATSTTSTTGGQQ